MPIFNADKAETRMQVRFTAPRWLLGSATVLLFEATLFILVLLFLDLTDPLFLAPGVLILIGLIYWFSRFQKIRSGIVHSFRTYKGIAWSGLVLALLAFPLFFLDNAYWILIAVYAGLYIIMALGLNIVVGMAGLLDLGFIAFYAIGAYTSALLSTHQGWPFWLCMLIGAIVACLFGVVLGAPTLRLRGDYLALVTIGFGEMVRLLVNNLDALTGGPSGISGIPAPSLGGYLFSQDLQLGGFTLPAQINFYYLVLALCGLVIFLVRRLMYSRLGRAWTAIREDELAARCFGVPTTAVKLLAFALGAFLGGLSGTIFASVNSYISPDSFVFFQSVIVLCMVIFGGMGNLWGVVLGAIILVVLPEKLRSYEQLRLIVFGFALVFMMLYRPQGLFPSRLRKRALSTRKFAVPQAQASSGIVSRREQANVKPNSRPLLEITQVSKRFGGVVALEQVSLQIWPGEILGVIGPNGSGKTTLFNLISGLYGPDEGKICLYKPDGSSVLISGHSPDQIARLGIARTFQNVRLFNRMSVLENVLVGMHGQLRSRFGGIILQSKLTRQEEMRAEAEAMELLALFHDRLLPAMNRSASTLSYANLRRLEIARALAAHPSLLLLDEPAAGMDPVETEELMADVRHLRAKGVTIMIVEHDLSLMADLPDRILVLDSGRRIAEGHFSQIQNDPTVIEAYLGHDYATSLPPEGERGIEEIC
ncbi:ATP-binding cassette domain-containing protein [Ktedonosporobacter rubrisoli]|uniref:ATP-binding cassette domain-containing protein n=1 Tax=Ktedonosporobacter rubrisoli TaxID=2509675 RepID=A0A4P6K0Y0_KTERU|nr:ATP-binding cassette domain-containing protein [Ktedonosporobacter rubrisoli]QBD81719.1 ATP-binding cassette domain-containing protein [Ktedonosporobacter rubrisoli]